MRRSQPSPEHAEAVSRRLATLSAELAAVRGDPPTHTRIRAEVPDAAPASSPEPVVISAPGRHVSRRPAGRLGEALPGWLGGGSLGPSHIAVVAVMAALAVGLASWLVVRDHAEPTAMPPVETVEPLDTPLASLAPSAVGSSTTAAAEATPGADASRELTVDVAGKVRRPGIAVLPAGSRVVDAIKRAGGAQRGVDLTSLNLARLLVDGEQILVGVPSPIGVAGSVGTPGTQAAGPLVNINSADQVTLEGLPGVGPVTATSIIDWRTQNGGFSSVEELLEVDGIGEATLADLAPLVTI